jgi:hypothetical protein
VEVVAVSVEQAKESEESNKFGYKLHHCIASDMTK